MGNTPAKGGNTLPASEVGGNRMSKRVSKAVQHLNLGDEVDISVNNFWKAGIVNAIDWKTGTVDVVIEQYNKTKIVRVPRREIRKRLTNRGKFTKEGDKRKSKRNSRRNGSGLTRPQESPVAQEVQIGFSEDIPTADTITVNLGYRNYVSSEEDAIYLSEQESKYPPHVLVDVLDKSVPLVRPPRTVLGQVQAPTPYGGWRWRPAVMESEMPDKAGYVTVRFLDYELLQGNKKLDAYPETARVPADQEKGYIAEYGTKSQFGLPMHPFKEGDVLDVEDRYRAKKSKKIIRKWRKCQVIRKHGPYLIYVTYAGWSRLYDEWFHVLEQKDRIAEFGSETEKILKEIESMDEKFSEKMQREKNLTVHMVEPDGNCLFRAVAHQVYGDVERHDIVRSDCCDYLEKNRDRFEMLVESGEEFNQYVENKRKLKVWGDDPEVRAMEELYDRPIELYIASADGPTDPLKMHFDGDLPSNEEMGPFKPIMLSFHGNNHYNSVIPYVTREEASDMKGDDGRKDISDDVFDVPELRLNQVIRKHRIGLLNSHSDAPKTLGEADGENEEKASF